MFQRLVRSVLGLVVLAGMPLTAQASTAAQVATGYITLQVESHGEAWYAYPADAHRYYLGRPTDAFHIMGKLGLGITNADLAKIPVAGSSTKGDTALQQQVAGYIVLQVQEKGEAWYVYPKDLHRYYLGKPDDAFHIMTSLGLGITNADLATIPIGELAESSTASPVKAVLRTIITSRGTFAVDQLSFDRTAALKVMTDTGTDGDCTTNCAVFSLGTYVTRHNGLSGIHGTYFCPTDYASCAGEANSYLYPVYNSFSKIMTNDVRIKFTTQPMVVFDTANKPYYYHDTRDFVSVASFQSSKGVTLRSAISNGPALIEGGKNILNTAELDSKQSTVHSYRGALGYQGPTIYLLVVHSATVIDSAAVLDAMGLDYAINLDGGGSTALYTAGTYILGPGRNLPNAIMITK